ncbi:MAG TPA: ABC transporter permease [Lacibacter sp.]|nr:ABC transporter permease [Lacibacter sp.]HMO87799.1 ABC transporter permease [Lacibacter sp.]HMP86356.1 ABC transporter permease [Lacibacter sp.]
MKKIWIIIKREYITRVRNKTFLLSTFLFPLFMIVFFAGSAYLGARSVQQNKIAVKDESGLYKDKLKNSNSAFYGYPEGVTQSNYETEGYDGLLVIYSSSGTAADSARLYSHKQMGLTTDEAIKNQIQRINEDRLLLQEGISRALLDSIRQQSSNEQALNYRSYKVKGSELKEDNKALAYGIGFGSGIIIYITLFVYGASVMRGVMEEKMNRIAEVMVSSVKPFQLMMGKIIGIAAVGLTQLLLWIVVLVLLTSASSLFLGPEVLQQAQEANNSLPGGMMQQNATALKMMEVRTTLLSANWGLIIACFLFYFLGGYLFYASLFAAIGSVINEDPQEAQSLMLPITMPIIFGFIIMSTTIENPTSPLAFWGSIIPFTSPIVMMARIPSGVPDSVAYWQLALSMSLLMAGFFFTAWLSGKIYRTGILLYGKKVTWKEMMKWVLVKR